MARETATEVDQAAAEWAAKVDRGLSAAEHVQFEAWRAGDVRRPGAYGRMRAISLHAERAAALGPAFEPASFQTRASRPPASRRALMAAGGFAVVLAGLGVLAANVLSGQRYQTRKGEVRQIALEDGSVIIMNTASKVAVHLSHQARWIMLTEGEALFDVAHDPKRPFYVSAGATLVRAIGASFMVSRLAGRPVQILVRDGVVEVTRPASVATKAVRLVANTRALSPPAADTDHAATIAVTDVALPDLHRELAWRDGRLAFEGQTLEQAAGEFARYSDIRVVVEDQALAKEEIAGLYQANDPVGFAQAVATSLNARAKIDAGQVRIVR